MAQLTLLNAIGHFAARRGGLWVFPDTPGEPPVTLCAFGLEPGELATLAPALVGTISAPGEPIALPEAAAASLAVAVPIETHDRRLGVVALGPRLGGEPYQGLDLEYLRTGGRMFGVALDNARLVHHMAESNRQLRRANGMLTELDAMRSQFVQNVNHEMRTPITIIKGYLQTLTGAGGGYEHRAIAAMLQQTDKLTRMVEDLLDYSALTERGVEMACGAVDVAALAGQMADDRCPGVLAGYRAFAFQSAARLPVAIADAARLERVLDELIDNAIKFTPPGTRIVLRTLHTVDDGGLPVTIEIEDDGPGIAPDQLESVFDPFRQGDGTSTRTTGGLGMGLALGRQMIERMGGRLEAASTPGRRTTFRIRLRAA